MATEFALAAADSLALNRMIAQDLGSFEVNGLNLRKWELIGRYVLLGDRAHPPERRRRVGWRTAGHPRPPAAD